MYGRHLEYRISQSLRNLTHSHHTTRATGDESGARKELDRLDSAVKCINISDVNIESKIFEILGIQLSADIIFTAYSLYRGTVRRQKGGWGVQC